MPKHAKRTVARQCREHLAKKETNMLTRPDRSGLKRDIQHRKARKQARREARWQRMTERQRKRKTAAQSYARRGWGVVLLHGVRNGICTCREGPSCTRPGKHPLLPDGVKGATKDFKVIKRWFRQHPHANIGVATGSGSGVIAIDVDPRNGGDASQIGLVRTATSLTGGGGTHHFFQLPKQKVPTSHGRLLGPGIDVLSDGAYVVMPPSRHISGHRYRWRDLQDISVHAVRPMPDSLANRLAAGEGRPPKKRVVVAADAGQRVPEGGRNEHLTRMAGHLLNTGLSSEAILLALQAENEEKCDPPLERAEIEKIATSVARYAAKTLGEDEAESLMRAVLDVQFAGGGTLILAPSWPRSISSVARPGAGFLSQRRHQ